MKTTKTLILAARIFLSLGIGTAMAQNLTLGGGEATQLAGSYEVATH
jgi:hypothetical protein